MKKIIFIILLGFVLSPAVSLAQNGCPYGKVDDPYPGDCGRYIDENKDGICDHSQDVAEANVKSDDVAHQKVDDDVDIDISGKTLKTKTVEEVADIYKIDADEYAKALSDYYNVKIKRTQPFQLLHDNYGVEPSMAKEIANTILSGEDVQSLENGGNESEGRYHLIIISIGLSFLYGLSVFLSKMKIVKVIAVRRFWNMVLLATFLITMILGVLLVLKENFGISVVLPFNILFWHAEIGIAMAMVSVFHILWHWRYFWK